MAKGSHQTYAGWESKTCHVCGAKLTHKTGAWYSRPVHDDGSFGVPVSFCRAHMNGYVGRSL